MNRTVKTIIKLDENDLKTFLAEKFNAKEDDVKIIITSKCVGYFQGEDYEYHASREITTEQEIKA